MIKLFDVVEQNQKISKTSLQEAIQSGRHYFGEWNARLAGCLMRILGGHPDRFVGVGSGTDALAIALRAVNAKRVAVPAATFVATAEAVLLAGAEPVIIDVDRSGLLDWEKVPVDRVDTVIPVHLWGLPVPLPPPGFPHLINIVEDACQAFGTEGIGYGRARCYSFYPTKTLGGIGDGGAIVADDPALTDRCRSIANHGRDAEDGNLHHEPGFSSRLDEVQAAALYGKAGNFEHDLRHRRNRAASYFHWLDGARVILPTDINDGIRPRYGSWYVFPVFLDDLDDHRAKVMGQLKELGTIEVGVHYPRALHQQPAFAKYAIAESLPNAERIARTQLSLPCHPSLGEDAPWMIVDRLKQAIRAVAG